VLSVVEINLLPLTSKYELPFTELILIEYLVFKATCEEDAGHESPVPNSQ
jgi:hypothetical protein